MATHVPVTASQQIVTKTLSSPTIRHENRKSHLMVRLIFSAGQLFISPVDAVLIKVQSGSQRDSDACQHQPHSLLLDLFCRCAVCSLMSAPNCSLYFFRWAKPGKAIKKGYICRFPLASCQAELVLLECGKVSLLSRVSCFFFPETALKCLITPTAEWANRRLTEVTLQSRKGSSRGQNLNLHQRRTKKIASSAP